MSWAASPSSKIGYGTYAPCFFQLADADGRRSALLVLLDLEKRSRKNGLGELVWFLIVTRRSLDLIKLYFECFGEKRAASRASSRTTGHENAELSALNAYLDGAELALFRSTNVYKLWQVLSSEKLSNAQET
ncbi:hypothetical protein DFH11DRAFT_1729709 [Phellopilus nigrolimitatus]|nr:hypothetical protein DFH11DRAFT_1729709 [Phellopilus nigrolimitatus]